MSNQPIVRQVAWISMIPQLFFMLFLFLFYRFLGFRDLVGFNSFIFLGALSYLILSFSLKHLIPTNHKKGLKLSAQEKFVEAIEQHNMSVEFFTKNSWIDKFRFITLLSSSKMSYREMGLCNIAYCYAQIGQIEESKKYYQIVIKEFPENGIAKSALRMFNAMESKSP